MNIFKRTALSLSIAATLMLSMSTASASNHKTVTLSLTNISNTVFTPPIFALCKRWMPPIARIGSPASESLEPLAEGGDTSALAEVFAENGCSYDSHPAPLIPGETIFIELTGNKNYYLHMASMLLPTNDGFIYSSNHKVRKIKRNGRLRLKSYDAGTEVNDELCANIPGPQCGGEGFNADRLDNNFVRPHPGLQGFADVSASTYNWGEPVAYIKVN